MAWALIFDGVNDYATITSEDLHTEVGRTTFEYEIFAAPDVDQSTFRVVGNPGTFAGQFSILTTGVQIRLGGAGSSQVNISYVQVFDGLYHTYKIRRDANDYSFLIDGVEVATTTSTAATGGNAVQYIGRVSGNFTHTNIGYIIFRDSIAGTELFNWDATASSHAAGTPLLLDTTGGNDASGVGMPTDGSAWVDLGGSGITVTGQTTNFSYSAINATIDLTGEISVTGLTVSYNYQSISGLVDLTGEISVLGVTPNYAYDTVNGTVELGAVISVIGQSPNYNYAGVNGVIELTGEININGSTPSYSYSAISGFVVIGEGQVIGTVTAGFADDLYSAAYKPSVITVNFKS